MSNGTHEHKFIFAMFERLGETAYRSFWLCRCGALRKKYHADDGVEL